MSDFNPRNLDQRSLHQPNGSRRRFLIAASGAAAMAALPLSAAQLAAGDAEPPRPLRLGLVTYNWGKDWDIPALIKNCLATGFSGVELRSTHKHGVEPSLSAAQRKEVRSQFADSDVELMGLGSACEYHSSDPAVVKQNIQQSKAFVRLCRDVGGSGIKVRPNGLPPGVSVEKTLEQIGKSLNEVARFAADFDVQIRLEVHGKGTSELPHIKTIMDVADHPNNAVCWNCNPQDLQGDGFAANFALVEDRLGTVHIHDLRNDNYPWEALFARLRNCRAPQFSGWTLLEEGSVPQEIAAAMRENRAIWERLAKA